MKTGKTDKNIQVMTTMEAIRMRSWMYLHNPKAPLANIITIFVDSFLCLGVREFNVCEEQNYFIIRAKQDWLNQNNDTAIKFYFENLIHIPNQFRALQAEVFLTAFYFPFYTFGDAGEHGDQRLFKKCLGNKTTQKLEHAGRILIISKNQKLPEDHGINFERPERSIFDLENEKRWLDLAIEQTKLNK